MSRGRRLQIEYFRLKIAICLLLALFVAPMLPAGEVYQSVVQELTKHENRLPGTDAYYSCLDHLEKTLKDGGLEPHRQTYETLVPETRECSLTLDGTNSVPIFALGPNSGANNTIGNKTLSGPIIYLGQGSLSEMDGKPVEGCIAVLDFDSPYLMQVLSQGALAVVFVGDGTETQWQVRQQFVNLPLEIPRLFVHKKDAEAAGLLSSKGDALAELRLITTWKDAEAVNLWVEIPGEDGVKFKFDQEEAIVLTATLDTFGTIPEQSPAVRQAANCALLADVAVQLRKQSLKRSVFVVFLGSHYGAQDGARMFYFAMRRAKNGELDQRAKDYLTMQEDSQARLKALVADNFFGQDSPVLKDVVSRIEKRLNAQVSTLNYDLRVTRDALLPLRKMQELMPADEELMAKLKDEEDAIQSRRKALNGMRREFNDKAITNHVLFAEIAAEEQKVIEREIEDVNSLIKHNVTHRELAARLSSKRLMGHFDIDFADATGEWMLNMEATGSQMFYHSMSAKWAELKLGDYVKNMLSIAEINDKLAGAGSPGSGLFTVPASSLVMPGKFCIPSIRSAPARVAHAMQVYGYELLTLGDSLDNDAMPYRHDVDLEPLVPRLLAFSAALAKDPAFSQVCPLAATMNHKDAVMHFRGEGGIRFLRFARGSSELAGVPDEGIAFCAPNKSELAPAMAGNSYFAASRIRASGHIFMPILYNQVKFQPFGYRSDGTMEYFSRGQGWADPRLFYGVGGIINAPLSPGGFDPVVGTLANGKTDSALQAYVARGNDYFAFYVDEDDPFKIYAKSGILLLGNTEAEPRGTGISMDDIPLYSFNVLRQTAHDYLVLNDSRLQILRDKAIVNDSLESLHADAVQHWDDAVAARKENNVSAAVAHEAFSAGISSRVAPALREVTNDMVRAVVLLLLLTLPFAFIMERLLISATSIYGQVVGFVALFLASFVLMYFVHPAFQVASSPLIIFLAFVIILLSALVISIVMSKFKKELRAMQGLSTSAHGAASDSSTGLAAVLIGISGMRNRPLKTFLTGLTIVLLTFAIVVFASFSPTTGVQKEYLGKGDGENRIELHRFSGLELPPMLAQALASLYSRDWDTVTREGFFRGPLNEAEGDLLVVFRKSTDKWAKLQGMVAFDPREMKHDAELAKAIPGFADYAGKLPPLFLAPRVVEAMEVSVGDSVTVGGKEFAFAGSFDASALDQMEYMDLSKIMPPDFETSKTELGGGEGEGGGQKTDLSNDEFVDTTRFTYCSARGVGLTVLGELKDLEQPKQPARMNAIVMYAKDTADVEDTALEIAKMFVGPVMAKSASGANKFFFSQSLQATGFSVVIVPLLLGGLIIFNSLLGSIVERQKEIFTYSAMGLSPPSVGALFFAESGVYAILGGMGGYFVSQIVAKLVGICGEMGWFVPPEMNFSSLSSVMTSFVVMGMVMISTIYPAIKAGRSANPGVARRWKMPPSKDGKIDFVFPFTVSADDMGGILAFISEHFENHGDASLGSFAATDVHLFKQDDGDGLGLRANLSLAPFDLGVAQAFSMFSRPSEIEGIDEIVVQLDKVSGTDGAWLRGNRVFVDDLREQFLLWRSLPVTTVMHYRKQSEQVNATEAVADDRSMEKQS